MRRSLLIRFTGPELWWLLGVTRWAAGVPGATVPVPAGVAGVLVIGLAGIANGAGVALPVASGSTGRRGGVPGSRGRSSDVSVGRDTIVG